MQQLFVSLGKRLQAADIKPHALTVLLLAVLLVCTGCASRQPQQLVYQSIKNSHYDKALKVLESSIDESYGKTDEVLYLLDSGVLAHYAGAYTDSNAKFSFAEKLIEEYYAKSIGQSVSSWFINDLVKDYEGEEFENIYSNIFMALNYIQLGMNEDAFVEIRRFDNKQRLLQAKYAEALRYADNQLKDSKADITLTTSQFNNSALARYLSMILYRSEKQTDNAAVDRKYITQAFETQQSIYNFPEPEKLLDDELNVPKDMARLNLISFTGLSPDKTEERYRSYNEYSDYYFTVAYPVMVRRPSSITEVRARVTAEDGTEYTVPLELIESIENIAADTFFQKQGMIIAKSYIRATLKAATTDALRNAAKKQKDNSLELISIFATMAQELTEAADCRTTRYFPAKVYITGLNLTPGIYTVTVEYLNKSGNVIKAETHTDVPVRARGINLMESLCLQ